MNSIRARLQVFALLSGLAGAFAAMAGTVNVSFLDPARYADAGNSQWDEKANLEVLGRYFQALGQLLPADQVLKVEVLDIDLAGTVVPSRRDGSPLRVVRGRADFPRMHLRYTLESPGQPARTGDEWLADLNYARAFPRYRASEPLGYETRMLQAWFKARFVDQHAAAH